MKYKYVKENASYSAYSLNIGYLYIPTWDLIKTASSKDEALDHIYNNEKKLKEKRYEYFKRRPKRITIHIKKSDIKN